MMENPVSDQGGWSEIKKKQFWQRPNPPTVQHTRRNISAEKKDDDQITHQKNMCESHTTLETAEDVRILSTKKNDEGWFR